MVDVKYCRTKQQCEKLMFSCQTNVWANRSNGHHALLVVDTYHLITRAVVRLNATKLPVTSLPPPGPPPPKKKNACFVQFKTKQIADMMILYWTQQASSCGVIGGGGRPCTHTHACTRAHTHTHARTRARTPLWICWQLSALKHLTYRPTQTLRRQLSTVLPPQTGERYNKVVLCAVALTL